jgi:hypothetical protein
MEAIEGFRFGNIIFYLVLGLVVAGLLGGFVYVVIQMRKTIPTGFQDMAAQEQEQIEQDMEGGATEEEEEAEPFQNMQENATEEEEAVVGAEGGATDEEEQLNTEGFYGGVARGAGIPDCFQANTAAARLFSIFAGRVGSVEQGTPDLSEFKLLLSQLGCFKKDLIGVAGVVDATRYQPFATQINMEPIAETTARCFAKTIPKRDLDLIFDKFKTRGNFLLTRLCTAADLTESETRASENLYAAFLKDVREIAEAKCLAGEPTINDKPISPREPVPRTPDGLEELRPYKGYY